MFYGYMVDRSLFLIRSLILDVEVVRDSAFTSSYSAFISDSYDYVGTYVGVLIKFCFLLIF